MLCSFPEETGDFEINGEQLAIDTEIATYNQIARLFYPLLQ